MSSSHQDTIIVSSKIYWLITTQQIFRQRVSNNSRFCKKLTKRHWFWIKKKIIFFRFDIDETFSIETINLKISVNVITFHIVFLHISFLLCLVDINRLRFYFNNLINMLFKEWSINKVFSRKELYFDQSRVTIKHSNKIKDFRFKILMSSKSLIRSDNIIDLQIDTKASRIMNKI
jgi:hypothetical protein